MNLSRTKNTKPATEPAAIADEQTAADVARFLAQSTAERAELEQERAAIDDRLADALAARVLGSHFDAAELIALSDRRDANQLEIDRLNLTIDGMAARLAELEAAERERRTAGLLPQLQQIAEMGETLTEAYYRQFLALADTADAIEANIKAYDTATREWSRASPNKGAGVDRPRGAWGIDPAVLHRTRLFPSVTLAGEAERWRTEPQRRAEASARERAGQKASAERRAVQEAADRERWERMNGSAA